MDPTYTITADPGAFGNAIGTLGFGEMRIHEGGTAGDAFICDHPDARVRLVMHIEDGDRVELIGWDARYPKAQWVAWKIAFDGATPQAIALAAIANAVGRLPITR
jgi:hypothetical protein